MKGGKEFLKLGSCKEVDLQAELRAFGIAHREAAIGVLLGDGVAWPDISLDGVGADSYEATWRETILGGTEMRMRGGAVTVLEDLDADDEIVARMCGQGAQVTADEVMAAIRCTVNQVFDRDRGDIESHEIEATPHQRQVVSAITTAM